jgi:hypothetical protein
MDDRRMQFFGEYLDPDWNEGGHVHNWRNHVGERVKSAWLTFTPEQRRLLALDADDDASNENWE